ncbi:MAG TPA: LysM peptidoglycan-binding domain-containing M23 family metallopeptidase [Anaerolineales bacterium]|nr:LysM peptidoglycan-binding domain-containing M23 family metallopeptidase [Anaerolineales bacterium]
MKKIIVAAFIFVLVLSGCSSDEPAPDAQGAIENKIINSDPIATYLPSANELANLNLTPTPDNLIDFFPTFTPLAPEQSITAGFPTPTPSIDGYVVQDGDYWLTIADAHNVTVEDLLAANNMSEFDIIYPGDVLKIPGDKIIVQEVVPESVDFNFSEYHKIIPDSELVFGPSSANFDLAAFISESGGYLAQYEEDVDSESWSGLQIIQFVSENYSINPRILLAILEDRSSWVTRADPAEATLEDPFLLSNQEMIGLYKQANFVADQLNRGYYSWLSQINTGLQLKDGTYWKPSLGVNAGTAGVLHFYANVSDSTEWNYIASPSGISATYARLFGNPFQFAVEPLGPLPGSQPKLNLPFSSKEEWYFTGGPHGGWGEGSSLSAIDFAPPEEYLGCEVSEHFATAVANGIIVRSGKGVVVLDLDGDGYEQTGWVVVYLHIASDGSVLPGDIEAGGKIGNPSCEGGYALASHLHIARKYNGQWISADDPNNPFILGRYTVIGASRSYDGYLRSGNAEEIEAFDGFSDLNKVAW